MTRPPFLDNIESLRPRYRVQDLSPYDLDLVDRLRCDADDQHALCYLCFLCSGSLALCSSGAGTHSIRDIISSPFSGSPSSAPGFTSAQTHQISISHYFPDPRFYFITIVARLAPKHDRTEPRQWSKLNAPMLLNSLLEKSERSPDHDEPVPKLLLQRHNNSSVRCKHLRRMVVAPVSSAAASKLQVNSTSLLPRKGSAFLLLPSVSDRTP